MTRGRWVFDRATGTLVPAAEYYARKYGDVASSDLAAPMVIRDVAPYRSIIDGSVIGGRRQHRDHLKAHGCVEIGTEALPAPARPATRPKRAEVIADIKRSVEDEGLRREALAASNRARSAVPE